MKYREFGDSLFRKNNSRLAYIKTLIIIINFSFAALFCEQSLLSYTFFIRTEGDSMKVLNQSILMIAAILVAWILPGCGDDHQDLAEDLSFYEPGEAVHAVKYSSALSTDITLYRLKPGGDINSANDYIIISNGDYIPKWKYENSINNAVVENCTPEVKVILNGHRYNVI